MPKNLSKENFDPATAVQQLSEEQGGLRKFWQQYESGADPSVILFEGATAANVGGCIEVMLRDYQDDPFIQRLHAHLVTESFMAEQP